ncbi:MAG: sel1 repeat family protein, partial [Nitrospina sp.]|nr:sel1 repeat family protein [Nitrospina sp.]
MRKALFIIFTLIFLLAVVTDFAVSQGTTIEIRKDKVVSQGIAVEILKNKAEQGNIRAQYDLGVRYDRGQGVVRDY